jgi:hypothetical protein
LLPLLSAACWFAFFYEIYGTPDPRAAYGGHTQTALANVARGAIGLLIDQRFGVLPNAPVYACSALGFVTLGRTRPRLAGELALLAGAYGCAAAAFEMWWAGYSSAARFLVPVLMPLSIPAAVWFQSTRGRASHILGIGGLLISLLMTATICVVDRGALLLNVRTAPSLLWTWLSPLVDVTSALPSLFENEPAVALAHACVWMAAIVITALAGTLVARRGASPSVVALAMGLIGAVAGMVALTIVWRSNRAAPLRPVVASLALLRQYDPDSRQLALRYAPLRRLTLSDLPPRLVLADAWPASIPRDRPMTFLEHLPPGVYAIDALASRAGGSVSVTLDRQFGPAWRWELLPEQRVWHREFRLPVAVAALELTLDDAARQAVDTLTLRAVTVAGTRERPARGEARDVIRYGSVLAFQMSEAGYIERGGIWAPGGAEADFVLDADTPQPLRLFLRNIPAENQVTLDVGGQRSEIAFGPGEERIVDVPISPDGHATRVRIAAARGAKPVDFEKGSTDTRLLGVWVEVR